MSSADVYTCNRKFADEYISPVCRIIRENLGYICSVEVASHEKDTKESTDFVVSIKSGDIAVRVRRPDFHCFDDVTIRKERPTGYETELSKIKKGFCNWYLYCWCNNDGLIDKFLIYDLNKCRLAGLFDIEFQEKKAQKSGESFIIIPVETIYKHRCIVNILGFEKYYVSSLIGIVRIR